MRDASVCCRAVTSSGASEMVAVSSLFTCAPLARRMLGIKSARFSSRCYAAPHPAKRDAAPTRQNATTAHAHSHK